MKIEMNKKVTIESLELDVLALKEELSAVREINTDLAKQLKELSHKLITKGVL